MPPIPVRIVIGVTGARKLADEAQLAKQVRSVLSKISNQLPRLSTTPTQFEVLSPIAEGADRLVVREALDLLDADLEVVLPLDKDDYLKDFESPESRAEFEDLYGRAHRIVPPPSASSRPEAYELAGRHVVDHCDVLIALWNGKPASGRGGTAAIVQYARARACPLYWIHAERGNLDEEPPHLLDPKPLQALDRYNSEKLSEKQIDRAAVRLWDQSISLADQFGLSRDRIETIRDYALSHFVRADLLAQRFQKDYLRAGTSIYLLAAVAVVLSASRAIVARNDHLLGVFFGVFEIASIATILVILWLGSWRKWHTKWIDSRFLAERLRSAFFMEMAGLRTSTASPPRHLSLSYSPTDWTVRAFRSIWAQLPGRQAVAMPLEALRAFLLKAWIEDQINHHQKASQRHHRRHRRLELTGITLFGLTFVAAVLHLFLPTWSTWLSMVTISFPAFGGALAAIRAHREYRRKAERSVEMVNHLTEIRGRMARAQNRDDLLAIVEEAQDIMAHEHADWRILVRFHRLETPG